jgi:hypothetical protein
LITKGSRKLDLFSFWETDSLRLSGYAEAYLPKPFLAKTKPTDRIIGRCYFLAR